MINEVSNIEKVFHYNLTRKGLTFVYILYVNYSRGPTVESESAHTFSTQDPQLRFLVIFFHHRASWPSKFQHRFGISSGKFKLVGLLSLDFVFILANPMLPRVHCSFGLRLSNHHFYGPSCAHIYIIVLPSCYIYIQCVKLLLLSFIVVDFDKLSGNTTLVPEILFFRPWPWDHQSCQEYKLI